MVKKLPKRSSAAMYTTHSIMENRHYIVLE